MGDVEHDCDAFDGRFEGSVSFVGCIESTQQVRQRTGDVGASDVECYVAGGLEEPQDVFTGVQVLELWAAVPVEQVYQDGRPVQVDGYPGCVSEALL